MNDDTIEQRITRQEIAVATNRVGCATPSKIVENVGVLPSGKPSSNDCPIITPHNADRDQGLSASDRSGKRSECVL